MMNTEVTNTQTMVNQGSEHNVEDMLSPYDHKLLEKAAIIFKKEMGQDLRTYMNKLEETLKTHIKHKNMLSGRVDSSIRGRVDNSIRGRVDSSIRGGGDDDQRHDDDDDYNDIVVNTLKTFLAIVLWLGSFGITYAGISSMMGETGRGLLPPSSIPCSTTLDQVTELIPESLTFRGHVSCVIRQQNFTNNLYMIGGFITAAFAAAGQVITPTMNPFNPIFWFRLLGVRWSSSRKGGRNRRTRRHRSKRV